MKLLPFSTAFLVMLAFLAPRAHPVRPVHLGQPLERFGVLVRMVVVVVVAPVVPSRAHPFRQFVVPLRQMFEGLSVLRALLLPRTVVLPRPLTPPLALVVLHIDVAHGGLPVFALLPPPRTSLLLVLVVRMCSICIFR